MNLDWGLSDMHAHGPVEVKFMHAGLTGLSVTAAYGFTPVTTVFSLERENGWRSLSFIPVWHARVWPLKSPLA